MKDKQITGYDNNGTVYDSGKYIKRIVNPEYTDVVKEIFKTYQENNFTSYGIVKTEIDEKKGNLKHQKYIISYPFEWPIDMYKDAVLFHLSLFKNLNNHGFTLKDSLPNNILFDGTNPVFVDFLSIVDNNNLAKESWLSEDTKDKKDARFLVFDKMFEPFMLIPLLVAANGNHELFRKLLSENSCNASKTSPSWNDVAIKKVKKRIKIRKLIKNIFRGNKDCGKESQVRKIKDLIKSKEKIGFINFIETLSKLIEEIQVTPPQSGYSSYYQKKGESYNFSSQEGWKPKQLVTFNHLKSTKPQTVLDIGANTGWFSIMAESLGSRVTSMEIDEASINSLYAYTKKNNLNILPLRLKFEDLKKEVFGFNDQSEIYKDRDFKNIPLFTSAIDRLKSDTVLCLALIHHLVLGMGTEVKDVLKILSDLTNKTLILEYVGFEDDLVKSEPSFFENIDKFSSKTYNMDIVEKEGKKYFKSIKIIDSHPSSRKLMIFTK